MSLNHIHAIYQDSQEYLIVMAYGNQQHSFNICDASGQAIMEQAPVLERDGYEEDATAFICWLDDNELVKLLTADEQRMVARWQNQYLPYMKESRPRSPITGHYRGGERA